MRRASLPKAAAFLLFAAPVGLWTAILLAQSAARVPPRQDPRVVPPREPIGPPGVTFNNQVVRIVQDHCQSCHREGGIAPFPLATYADAYVRRAEIREQTSRRLMPPWHAAPGCTELEDNPSLSEEEIERVGSWVASGAPEGDPRDLPPPRQFPDGWQLGQPDQILTMSEPMTPDFSRGDVYRCFVLPTDLAEDRFLSAVEVAPGIRPMVHHALLYVDSGTSAERLDSGDPGPGYACFGGPGFLPSTVLGGWVPGDQPRFLPEGVALHLPRSSKVVIQLHYSARSGVAKPDRTSVALYFARQPVRKRLLIAGIANENFTIPAGARDYEVTAAIPFLPASVHLRAVTPHMHLLGQKMRVTAALPDGRRICLVDVPQWDFHWQRTYFYKDPVHLPIGTRLDVFARYDNSGGNPRNPNSPPRDVGFGEQTTDEMCLVGLFFTLDLENLSVSARVAPSGLRALAPLAGFPFSRSAAFALRRR